MKTFLLSILVIVALAVSATAQSPYAGNYFGLSYFNGQAVAGLNITVRPKGKFVGRGAYLDLTPTTITGSVDETGKVSITERSGGKITSYTAFFATNGKKFLADLSTGNKFKGKKLNPNFPQAGIYSVATDIGERGIVLVDRNGAVYGVVYDPSGNMIEIDGEADGEGFSGSSVDGVYFEGTFNGASVSGSYTDGFSFEGTFRGGKY